MKNDTNFHTITQETYKFSKTCSQYMIKYTKKSKYFITWLIKPKVQSKITYKSSSNITQKNKKHKLKHEKYLITFENKQNFSITWTLPYIYPRKHIKIYYSQQIHKKISKNYNITHKHLQVAYKISKSIFFEIWTHQISVHVLSKLEVGIFTLLKISIGYHRLVILNLVFIEYDT